MEEFLFEGCENLVKWLFRSKYPPERDKPYCRQDPINGKTLSVQVWEVLEDLRETRDGDRRRRAIILSFGLEDGQKRTEEEIGQEFRVTRQRVNQIKNEALRYLGHPSRWLRLKLYLENKLAHEAAAASLKKIEAARKERKRQKEAKKALWERFLQPKNLSFEERQGEIRTMREIYEKTQIGSIGSIGSTAFPPNRFINKILRWGILFSDLKTFNEEELAIILDMPGSKTEQVLREMWQIARES